MSTRNEKMRRQLRDCVSHRCAFCNHKFKKDEDRFEYLGLFNDNLCKRCSEKKGEDIREMVREVGL